MEKIQELESTKNEFCGLINVSLNKLDEKRKENNKLRNDVKGLEFIEKEQEKQIEILKKKLADKPSVKKLRESFVERLQELEEEVETKRDEIDNLKIIAQKFEYEKAIFSKNRARLSMLQKAGALLKTKVSEQIDELKSENTKIFEEKAQLEEQLLTINASLEGNSMRNLRRKYSEIKNLNEILNEENILLKRQRINHPDMERVKKQIRDVVQSNNQLTAENNTLRQSVSEKDYTIEKLNLELSEFKGQQQPSLDFSHFNFELE